jgi:hypothetical protein
LEYYETEGGVLLPHPLFLAVLIPSTSVPWLPEAKKKGIKLVTDTVA